MDEQTQELIDRFIMYIRAAPLPVQIAAGSAFGSLAALYALGWLDEKIAGDGGLSVQAGATHKEVVELRSEIAELTKIINQMLSDMDEEAV